MTLQKQVKYLAELLRDVPGFAVSQSGGAGSQTQVRVPDETNQLNHQIEKMLKFPYHLNEYRKRY